ncbi:MAG TPA: helix-turn-helix transcriptional regulator [Pseudonocardiaceae bacterium]|jgi:transcriptional regulator with XRE-family HTH domain/catechol 2,3-dioxygenase-like lactoylglutathione lyase family enzyme|nr:helix-turn-helix transcriptional regulator [Pseudonocardiaceae bacterium]
MPSESGDLVDDQARTIGRRLREVRYWRRKSLRAVAELAGLSESYLSRLERGERPVERRSTLEALAAALEVAPGELTGSHKLVVGEGMGEVHAAVVALRVALADNSLDDPADDVARPWPELAADLHRVNNDLRPRADHAALGLVLPDLIADLQATAAVDPDHRNDALVGLLDVYAAAVVALKHLGESDLAAVAALHARAVADEVGSPAHTALAEWVRALAVSSPARERSLTQANRAAERVQPVVGSDGAAAEMYGMLHLMCALNAAALNRYGESADHEAEAADVAARVGTGTNFGHTCFGEPNYRFWQVTLAVERGEGGKVAEIARDVDPTAVASPSRRAGFYTDLGRGLATDRGRCGDAVAALRTAEQLAPQRVRANPYVRETVTDLLRRARRDAEGRELRGLAYRMGVGVG